MVVFNEDEIFMWHCIAFGVYFKHGVGERAGEIDPHAGKDLLSQTA